MIEVVVMGASWGGLEAIQIVLRGLPDGFNVPILVAQHRAVDGGDGMLETLLGRHSKLPVHEVYDKDEIAPGAVFVAPPNYHMLVEAPGRLALSVDEPVAFSRPSIDVLFESAADAYRVGVAGVLLTGANDDGTSGLRAIKRHGGVTLVQDPADAERSEMPAAAVRAGVADRVLPLDQIADALAEVCA